MAKANVSLGGRDILDLDSLSIEEYEMILQTAAEMKKIMKRDIKKVPSLRGKSPLLMLRRLLILLSSTPVTERMHILLRDFWICLPFVNREKI